MHTSMLFAHYSGYIRHGDGGGGPTPEMLERLQRMRNVDGLPTVKPGSATQFFEGLEKNSDRLQSYKGELVCGE